MGHQQHLSISSRCAICILHKDPCIIDVKLVLVKKNSTWNLLSGTKGANWAEYDVPVLICWSVPNYLVSLQCWDVDCWLWTYMEYWMASVAVDDGRKSFTATSLFSFFLSVQSLKKTVDFQSQRPENLKGGKDTIFKSGVFLKGGEVGAVWCQYSAYILDHQHRLRLFYHLFLPG